MKNIHIKKFLIVQMIVFLIVIFITLEAQASSLSTSGSATEGGSFSVTLNVPDGAIAAQANITVEYADGTKSTDTIAYAEGNGTKTVSFPAKVAGNAKITASNVIVCDSDGNALENNGSTSTSISINSKNPEPAQTPTNNAPATTTSAPAQATKEPNFKSVNETVYATKSMNVRASWSTSSNKVGGLSEGQAVTRTGIGDNGWSRISYNGKTAYVSTSLITTTEPEKVEEEPEEEPEEVEENVDNEIYQKLVDEIGTIPEVGNNVNVYIFWSVLALSIVSIIIIFRKEA